MAGFLSVAQTVVVGVSKRRVRSSRQFVAVAEAVAVNVRKQRRHGVTGCAQFEFTPVEEPVAVHVDLGVIRVGTAVACRKQAVTVEVLL